MSAPKYRKPAAVAAALRRGGAMRDRRKRRVATVEDRELEEMVREALAEGGEPIPLEDVLRDDEESR